MKLSFRLLLPVYFLLLVIAIPWYWPADDRTVYLGLPAWALAAYAASGLTSLFTAIALGRLFAETPPGENPPSSIPKPNSRNSRANRVD